MSADGGDVVDKGVELGDIEGFTYVKFYEDLLVFMYR
jgi:hypothetical protein